MKITALVALGVTMFIPNSVVQKALSRVAGHAEFDTVSKIAEKNSYCPFYYVGGMIYRNLAIEYHKDAPKYAIQAAADADFDILVMGKPQKAFIPSGWSIRPRAYFSDAKYSYALVNKRTGLKVDMVSIHDIAPWRETKGQKPTVQDYFRAVPLDIQAIASPKTLDSVFGHGIEAICSKQIRMQNRDGLIYAPPVNDPEFYGDEKAATMGFTFVEAGRRVRECSCDSRSLFWNGCRCNGKIK